ncbi:hypothetical protein LXL04_015970 [Taraxacum kok-saghyz]
MPEFEPKTSHTKRQCLYQVGYSHIGNWLGQLLNAWRRGDQFQSPATRRPIANRQRRGDRNSLASEEHCHRRGNNFNRQRRGDQSQIASDEDTETVWHRRTNFNLRFHARTIAAQTIILQSMPSITDLNIVAILLPVRILFPDFALVSIRFCSASSTDFASCSEIGRAQIISFDDTQSLNEDAQNGVTKSDLIKGWTVSVIDIVFVRRSRMSLGWNVKNLKPKNKKLAHADQIWWEWLACANHAKLNSDLAENSTNPPPLATAKTTACGEGVVSEAWRVLSERDGEGDGEATPPSLKARPPILTIKTCVWRCPFANTVWTWVLRWCGIPMPNISILCDLLEHIHNQGDNKRRRRDLIAICYGTLWIIWKAKCERIFKKTRISPTKAVDNVKSKVYTWVKHRRMKCRYK